MKPLRFHPRLWTLLFILLACLNAAQAGLKIYYIRHAEGGHNVVKEWEEKPKAQWPAYVGNANMFTPQGEMQVVKATEKLKQYRFDFIAVSPVWRTRHTILPYLKEAGRQAEIWPELGEFDPFSTNLMSGADLPPPSTNLFTGGDAIILPEQEKEYFVLRNGGGQLLKFGKEPKQFSADVREAAERAVAMLRKRFGGSDKSILLVGHGNSGQLLLHFLTRDNEAQKITLANTGIWMVEEQADGSFKLCVLNDTPVKP